MEGSYLSKEDVRILKEVVALARNKQGRTLNRPYVPEELGDTPDVYVARPPAGVPALTLGTGTGSNVHDSPGYADVTIYRILLNPISGKPVLQQVGIPSVRAYNLSGSNLAAGKWVIVERTKFGEWVIEGVGTAGSGGESGQWVQLVGKKYADPRTVNYDWRGIISSIIEAVGTGPSPTHIASMAWRRTGQVGDLAIEVSAVDLAVDSPEVGSGTGSHGTNLFQSDAVVFLRPVANDVRYRLFEQSPRWELAVKIGPVFNLTDELTGITKSYNPGLYLVYDQVNKKLCSKRPCLLLETKCLSLDDDNCCGEGTV